MVVPKESLNNLRRLTVVAFVFIPLTFATSFFGMNVRQLGTGDTNIGFFVLTAVVAGCLSMCLTFGLRPWERAVTRRKERLAEDMGVSVNQVSFANVVRSTKLAWRFLEYLDPSVESTTFHGAIMFWARSHLRDLRAWAVSFRKKPQRDEDTPDQDSRELSSTA